MWKRTLNTSKPFSTSTTKLAKIQSPNSVSHRNTPILNSLFQSSASYSSSPPFVREIEELYPTAGGLYFGGSRFHKENVNLFVRKKNSFCSESQSAKKLHCWSCGATADGTTLFLVCQACRSVQPVNHSIDYYQILGVERKFNIEVAELEGKYKDWQKKLHPDLVHSKSQREREYAAEQSARVNDAYRTLTDPLSRAIYILKLENVVVNEEERITDPELLAEILELREAVEEAKGTPALNQIKVQIQEKMQYWCNSFEDAFLNKKYDDAIGSIERITYYKRAKEEIVKKL
ncbi:iron-sulfur cluster co-chaperone protein HscB, mitochondrial-like [Olea europaea var. sylvestris]|uniref:iron-sulfur cluster co-chaperone protein HscB, mitochondrial-like n=1 Tax=Olea europaea var. sylvestris TaxID=158386 RepID=UPI000C1D5612|nr:iron-sulfur cluster co-chaperone protein HscB, mitochondrial-like [Olea europaea var. sylvestris]